MHYYKRNIGDYHKKAGRLTMLQHGAYTLLMDSCYDREQFPTREEAIDWLWASTKEEIEAVEFVLGRFFTLDGDVYVQQRIKEELDSYHEKAKTNKRIAIEREAKRKINKTKKHEPCTDGEHDVNEPSPNQEPRTNNHKSITKFIPPSADEAQSYFEERGFGEKGVGQRFVDHYSANGWMRGKNKIKDWKACVRTWCGNMKPVIKPIQQQVITAEQEADRKRKADEEFAAMFNQMGSKQ